MPERTHFSVGSYSPQEIWRVLDHARAKGIGYQTIQGPRDNFQLEDGSRVTVPEGKTAVVLVTNGPDLVSRFWDDFQYPEQELPSLT